MDTIYPSLQTFVEEVLDHPQKLTDPNHEIELQCQNIVKILYDETIKTSLPTLSRYNSLSSLYVDGFDPDQIWEQIQLQNDPALDFFENQHRTLTKSQKSILQELQIQTKNPKEISEPESEHSISEPDAMSENQENSEDLKIKNSPENENSASGDEMEGVAPDGKSPGDLFNYDEMEEFVEQAELEEMGVDYDKDDEEDEDQQEAEAELYGDIKPFDAFEGEMDPIDKLVEDLWEKVASKTKEEKTGSGEEEDEDEDFDPSKATYKDFFDPPERTDEKNGDGDDENEENDLENIDTSKLSKFEMHQLQLKKQIKNFENELVKEKSWQLMGEVVASKRPENSLLEEHLEFQQSAKPNPVITEEVTKTLEDIIKSRILDGAFDDVVRKINTDSTDHRPTAIELDQKKSEKGLAQIYEESYLKSTQNVNMVPVQSEQIQALHVKAATLFHRLSTKLDALSHAHYVPRKMDEQKIDSKTPAISMEEPIPVAVSNEETIAPQDIYKSVRHLKSEAEITTAEKKAKRRKHKERNAKKSEKIEMEKNRLRKINPNDPRYSEDALGQALSDRNTRVASKTTDSTDYSNSSVFFKKLQNEIQTIATKEDPETKKRNLIAQKEKINAGKRVKL
eukprot:TRINITY_DN2990_c0_g1_i4.p1 TRINITY_DN2990_c0_g1~~TRINITY_DN2990_c0_g1_i4.p1  ORF type:complete len:623 (-),score=184.18 TRINITY_DN2990_c0_g1_i4:25-1893(-)